MTEPTMGQLRAASLEIQIERIRADFEAKLSPEAREVWALAGSLAQLAPHGGFSIHVNEHNRGPNNELAVYVICECGRGYSWERKIPDVELVAWLSNHGPDIPLDEEERRVAAAGGREPITRRGVAS